MNKSEKLKAAWVFRRPNFVPPMKGKKMSIESRAKMSAAAKLRGSNRTGSKHTKETRRKISEITKERTPRGEAHYAWKNGAKKRLLNDRRKAEYYVWRDAVFARDKYTCQKCKDAQGGNLRAHHIMPFSTHKDLRFVVENGLTLCHTCHELEHFKPDSIRNARKLRRGERLWK